MLWVVMLLPLALCQKVEKVDGIFLVTDGPFRGTKTRIPGSIAPLHSDSPVRYPAIPLSARTIYRPFIDETDTNNPIIFDPVFGDPLYDTIIFEGEQLNLLGDSATRPAGFDDDVVRPFLIQYKFASVTPIIGNGPCTQALAEFDGAVGTIATPRGPRVNDPPVVFLPFSILPRVGGLPVFGTDDTKQGYVFPTDRLGLSIFEEDGWWLCLENGAGPNQHIFTNILYQATPPCDVDAAGVVAPLTHDPNYADDPALNRLPTDCSAWTTFDPTVSDADLWRAEPTLPPSARLYEDINRVVVDANGNIVAEDFAIRELSRLRQSERIQRTTCCGSREQILDVNNNLVLQKRWGLCINPLLESCCASSTDNRESSVAINIGGNGKPFSTFREQCCFGGDVPLAGFSQTAARVVGQGVFTLGLDDNCPCIIEDAADAQVRPSPAVAQPWCGTEDRCCDFFKYAELQPAVGQIRVGLCFDPEREGCCDTGEVFDKGSQQCCVINGLQSLNDPCPCAVEADCRVPQVPFLQGNKTCCRQQFPDLTETNLCSPYLNYPFGNGLNEVQSCPGQCIDLRYQSCCNGVACIDEYERCCNSTCCNRFTSTCIMGIRPGSPGNPFNSLDFKVPFESCSVIEALTPYHAVMVYLLPICLLIATYLGLAFSLFFAKRVNALNPLSGYEKLMFLFAVLIIIFGWPMYFTPLYKYGIVIVWVGFFTIVAALSGIKLLVLLVIIAQAILLLYVYDPFYGNEILSLAYIRPDRSSFFSGILHSLRAMWDAPHDGTPFDWKAQPVDLRERIYNGFRCTGYYDGFFRRDPMTEDYERYDNPYKYTFGFCARDFYSALVILEGVLIFLVVFLFLITIITHLKNILVKKVLARSYFANPIVVME